LAEKKVASKVEQWGLRMVALTVGKMVESWDMMDMK
jgi:hypothetical protein